MMPAIAVTRPTIAARRSGRIEKFSHALIHLVLEDKVDREVAANAASNRHDFLIALERALKERAAAAAVQLDSVPDPEGDPEPEPPLDEAADESAEANELPRLRVAGQQ